MGSQKGEKFPPSVFNGAEDSESLKKFISALENYFNFMFVNNPSQHIRFSERLLQDKVKDGFKPKTMALKNFFGINFNMIF